MTIAFRPLAILPTPLEEAPRLSQSWASGVLVKRDDQTGLALGGNKARKLDYLLKDAIEQRVRYARHRRRRAVQLLPHDRRRRGAHGLACHLVLGGDEPARLLRQPRARPALRRDSCTSPARTTGPCSKRR